MRVEWLIRDVRYALRGMRASPLFAAAVAGNMGLGLGILCSAFTVVNAYLLKPIALPDAQSLYSLSWETAGRHAAFRFSDYQALTGDNPIFTDVTAGSAVTVVDGEGQLTGQVVSGNYFQLLGARALLGRTLLPEDAASPGASAVVVLSNGAWRSRYGADPTIVGREIPLGRHRYEVVGVLEAGSTLPGDEAVGFWAPLTMAGDLGLADPWRTDAASLSVIARLRPRVTAAQARAWLETWLRLRFPSGPGETPAVPRVESRATRIPLNGATLTLFSLLLAAFGMVLLVACANVTNLMMARGLGRHRELAIRLSIGATRARVVGQLLVESLVLMIPAAAVGLAVTVLTARIFPLLILRTMPGSGAAAPFLVTADPDLRVLGLLVLAASAAAVLVGLSPARHVTRRALARGVTASRHEAEMSRPRLGLVAMQIGASATFLAGAVGLVTESMKLARADTGLAYERVLSVDVAPALRAGLLERLASDVSVERVAAVRRPPLSGPVDKVRVLTSTNAAERHAGLMEVSADYFPLFDIPVVRGRAFTGQEAAENAAVAVVSAATARTFWPGQDPIGQTLDLLVGDRQQNRRDHIRTRVVGVAADVISGSLIDGVDATCIYRPLALTAPGELALLLRGRTDTASPRRAVAAAISEMRPGALFSVLGIGEALALQVWAFAAFSAIAAALGLVGLLLAFSGTYAVVAFLVRQQTRELGIRMALGATVQRLVAASVAGMLRGAAAGALCGLVAAALLAQAADATIEMMPGFGFQPYLTAAVIVLVATATAALLPSLQMARIDPSSALRAE